MDHHDIQRDSCKRERDYAPHNWHSYRRCRHKDPHSFHYGRLNVLSIRYDPSIRPVDSTLVDPHYIPLGMSKLVVLQRFLDTKRVDRTAGASILGLFGGKRRVFIIDSFIGGGQGLQIELVHLV